MTMPVLTHDLETARQIVLERLKGYRVRVYLFGSRAIGKARRYSDIDVAVLPLETVPGHVLSDIREALEECNILYEVDVVNLSEVDEKFRQRVLKEGVLWSE